MEPDLHRTARKAAFLVQTLRRNITALRHYADFLSTFLLKPADRVHYQASSQTFSACLCRYPDQPDLPCSQFRNVACQVAFDRSPSPRDEYFLGPPATALFDPRLIQLVALPLGESSVVIKSRVSVCIPGNFAKCGNITLFRITKSQPMRLTYLAALP